LIIKNPNPEQLPAASQIPILGIDIPSYLELVFHSCGTIEGRRRLLKKYCGHTLPILTPDLTFFEQYPIPDFNQYTAELFFPESTFWS
jgi:hypothetical protein